MNRITVDTFGGDHAPEEIVNGAIMAMQENSTIKCILVGDENVISKILENQTFEKDRMEIRHTSEYITMEDSPKKAILSKPKASINIAAQLSAKGDADAMVSAGNTGATILSCSQFIPRIPGVERAGLGAVVPAYKQKREDPGKSIVLDVGATLRCSTNQLVSFALMGTHYAKEVMLIDNPRVGLLNIGEEQTKGHSTLIEANTALQNCEGINFMGNVEGKDILRGIADVIITEGLVGNVALKAIEGLAEMTIETGKRIWKKNLLSKLGLLMLMPVLKKLKRRIDYSEYGGAPIMGFEKLIIKAHGRSNAKAIKNAIHMANTAVENNVVDKIRDSVRDYLLLTID
jgi:glycerol-3-phosphate acyltransferase PlsX